MFEIDRNRVFNESPKKVLVREFNNLKNDYTKRNAIAYKSLYENASLSFILENSQYIFTEPMRGCEFYKNVIEKSVIPFHLMESECDKVSDYIEENGHSMSDTQKNLYLDLKESVDSKYESMKNSIHLYTSIMEDVDCVIPYYDALYEYKKNVNNESINKINELLTESDSINLMDTINIISSVPELYPNFLEYVEEAYVENPYDPESFELNSYTANVISRMMNDSYIKERVESISNMNLRHTIMGLSGVEAIDSILDIRTEHVDDDIEEYTEASDIINDIYDNEITTSSITDYDDEEKAMRLLCEKSVIDINLAFTLVDSYYDDENSHNGIIEKLYAERSCENNVPKDRIVQTKILQEMSDNLKEQILSICEKYFTPDGRPSPVIANSIGIAGVDDRMSKDKNNKTYGTYTPYRPYNDEEDKKDEDEVDDSEEAKAKDRADKKDKKMNKYADMSIDEIDFNESATFENMLNFDYVNEAEDDKIPELSPPQKRNVFQRIQNKAIDTNVKFKKKVANAKRKRVDARNAAKASAAIPNSVTSSIKKTVDDWDEMDDNRRKEYIIKPGFRKKYFRALKLCILHYGAFAINPVLNVVLLICQRLGKSKDKRVTNELIRELKAEIQVTEEKIEDAKANGDNKQKYQLMRIKEKLKAELVRIEANTKYV